MTSDEPTLVPTREQGHERDLLPSHVYRLGVGLFKSQPIRRRVIEASLFCPSQKTPHAELLRRTLDGREERTTRPPPLLSPPEMPPAQPQALAGSDVRTFTEDDYHCWLYSRRSMRASLDGAGLTERWLRSKNRTELEGGVLARLVEEERRQPVIEVKETTPPDQGILEATPQEPSQEEQRAARRKLRKCMLREAGRAGRRLLRARQRLVALLVAADRNMEGSIAGEELVTILGRVGVALTPECSQALIQALLREGGGGGGGKVDYRRMVAAIGGKGEEEKEEGLVSLLRQHLDRRDIPASSPGSPISDALPLVERLSDDDPLVRSTMRDGSAQAQREGGAHGEAVESCKKEQLRQFAVLLDYCRRNGVVLSKELAERALLWPADHPTWQCREHLRQPGLDLLSSHFADPPEEEAPPTMRCVREEYGGAYLELRPRSRAKTYSMLSTGRAMVSPKTDCWLTYEEFLRLTEHIRSRPGFKYKYHGLPKNNAFWPGAMLDKLRLCPPFDGPTPPGGPCSVHNIFQHVDPSRTHNRTTPTTLSQVTSWPSNKSGYVQFGSQDRKQYAI